MVLSGLLELVSCFTQFDGVENVVLCKLYIFLVLELDGSLFDFECCFILDFFDRTRPSTY